MTASEITTLVGVCGSIILGILALATTIVKMILDYKERRAHFRQALYAKQLEGYNEITLAVTKLYQEGDSINFKALSKEEVDVVFLRIRPTWEALDDSLRKWKMFVSNDFHQAVMRFTGIFCALSSPPQEAADFLKDLGMKIAVADLEREFGEAFGQVSILGRLSIGTDPLTEDVSHVIGTHTKINHLRMKQVARSL